MESLLLPIQLNVAERVRTRYPGHGTAAWLISIEETSMVESRRSVLQNEYLANQESRHNLGVQIERWKSVFRTMDAKNGERSSIETLARIVERRGGFPKWHPFVDFYNALSMACATPLGAYDASILEGFIRLDLGPTDVSFTPLGRGDKSESVRDGEVFYRDARRVLCRMWNRADCDAARITESTRQALVIADLVGDAAHSRAIYDRLSSELEYISAVSFTSVQLW